MKERMTLIVLPTLDGSREAAIERIEAWESAPRRRWVADDVKWRTGRLGEMYDRLDLLGVAS